MGIITFTEEAAQEQFNRTESVVWCDSEQNIKAETLALDDFNALTDTDRHCYVYEEEDEIPDMVVTVDSVFWTRQDTMVIEGMAHLEEEETDYNCLCKIGEKETIILTLDEV